MCAFWSMYEIEGRTHRPSLNGRVCGRARSPYLFIYWVFLSSVLHLHCFFVLILALVLNTPDYDTLFFYMRAA